MRIETREQLQAIRKEAKAKNRRDSYTYINLCRYWLYIRGITIYIR